MVCVWFGFSVVDQKLNIIQIQNEVREIQSLTTEVVDPVSLFLPLCLVIYQKKYQSKWSQPQYIIYCYYIQKLSHIMDSNTRAICMRIFFIVFSWMAFLVRNKLSILCPIKVKVKTGVACCFICYFVLGFFYYEREDAPRIRYDAQRKWKWSCSGNWAEERYTFPNQAQQHSKSKASFTTITASLQLRCQSITVSHRKGESSSYPLYRIAWLLGKKFFGGSVVLAMVAKDEKQA